MPAKSAIYTDSWLLQIQAWSSSPLEFLGQNLSSYLMDYGRVRLGMQNFHGEPQALVLEEFFLLWARVVETNLRWNIFKPAKFKSFGFLPFSVPFLQHYPWRDPVNQQEHGGILYLISTDLTESKRTRLQSLPILSTLLLLVLFCLLFNAAQSLPDK